MRSNYGEEVRIQRKRMGVKQSELANVLNISESNISYRENGIRDFTVEQLYKSYKVCGIDIGFGSVFDSIDNESEKLKSIMQYFSQQEQEKIQNKDYVKMSIQTLEKLLDLMKIKEEVKLEIDFSSIEMRLGEKLRLMNVLRKCKARDGNLSRAIELLEIAMR